MFCGMNEIEEREEAEIATFTPEELREYEDSLKTYRDLKNSLDTAEEKGRVEGREEGRVEGRVEEKNSNCTQPQVDGHVDFRHLKGHRFAGRGNQGVINN